MRPKGALVSSVRMRGMLAAWVAAGSLSACSNTPPDEVFIRGSDTMRPLLEAWRQGFQVHHPRTRVFLSSGGSSLGMYAVLNGFVDLCASSRPITERERRVARRKGLKVHEIEVARDGLAVVVNADNPVRSLELDELRGIFTGELRQWSELGGADIPIQTWIRGTQSGTRAFFRSRVLGGGRHHDAAQEGLSTEAIVDEVAQDPGALGYVGMASAQHRGVHPLRLGTPDGAVAPAEVEVQSGRYPLTRSLYLYAVVTPTGVVQRFVDHALGPEGQTAVRKTGFVSLKSPDRRAQL